MEDFIFNRHTCIICGKKRNELFMKNVFGSSWACTKTNSYLYIKTCVDSSEILTALEIIQKLKTLKRIKLSHLSTASNVRPELTISRDK